MKLPQVSLLANEFDVRSVLHGQVSLAAVNQIYVIHEAMKDCKILKVHLRIASNLLIYTNIYSLEAISKSISIEYLSIPDLCPDSPITSLYASI